MAEFSMKLQMNPDFTAVIARTPEVQEFTFKVCERLKAKAQEIFRSQVLHTHPVTVPPYEFSFFIRKTVDRKGGANFIVGNNDPAAVMVEFGAHPGGGSTEVLAYHPLGRAMDSMEGGV